MNSLATCAINERHLSHLIGMTTSPRYLPSHLLPRQSRLLRLPPLQTHQIEKHPTNRANPWQGPGGSSRKEMNEPFPIVAEKSLDSRHSKSLNNRYHEFLSRKGGLQNLEKENFPDARTLLTSPH